MTALRDLLDGFEAAAKTPRELGTYFEELMVAYFRHEPAYRELYAEVLTFSDWAAQQGRDGRDAGIDLVARTYDGEFHAIQCKFYRADYHLQKADIDSFFTASGKEDFAHRIIVATTSHWSEHAEDALSNQQVPVNKIDLNALENSAIDWSQFAAHAAPILRPKKKLREHQASAVNGALTGLSKADRGKLIMACGTGKTFTSLKVAEKLAGAGKRVLFLVPSLALLSQTLTEWTQESEVPLRSFAVCSDSDVGKKRKKKDDDSVQTFAHELQYPATTDPARLATEMKKRHDAKHMSVVYGTYHSIDVLSLAQKKHGLPAFDLIVCDEAHRTTGAKFEGEDESHFTKVHDGDFLAGKKRLYMTATPRIYADFAKAVAIKENADLFSMDDEAIFGLPLYTITFSEAVKRGLLVDYKVIVLSIDAKHVSSRLQDLLKDENNTLRVDDAAKIIGCYKALTKQGLEGELVGDRDPMRRAVAFCQVIELQKGAKVHKVSSKNIASMFEAVVEAYQATEPPTETDTQTAPLRVQAEHVDGGMNATEKEEKITWLKDEAPEHVCRVLSNVRCLSEGVDVPALDAVLFLTPRSSQIDVVQSVGRVMRNAPGKKRGYIVLPVVIPDGMAPDEALNDNEHYRVVWQVLQALRSHDDRFDAMVNKLELIGKDPSKMEVIAITDRLPKRAPEKRDAKEAAALGAKGSRKLGEGKKGSAIQGGGSQRELEFEIGEIERAIYAKLVQKVGNRHHWEDWAKDIAKIAQTHIVRITAILADPKNVREREEFDKFAAEVRDDLNESITNEDIVEMLAQHLVTRPVFDALFAGHSFATENPMSRAMQGILDLLEAHRLDKEAATLEKFYESVKLRASGIDSAEGKQKIVIELYDKFFKSAFPRMSERLGIVYTPIEIVDFILHSVADILKEEFGQTLGSEGVHILDPFTGTGTFITRLIQSGLIDKDALVRKYQKEIHANELVLLAYYIAAINIEAAFHGVVGGEYRPFEGICLTDTFQLYEKEDLISRLLVDNSARRKRQKKLDIRVIVGNPPYSVGQKSANDNNQNVAYAGLDQRIADTYAAKSSATLKTSLYDSYVRAIRWASDRIGTSGVIGFVTNAGFIDGAADGLRKCLADEFSSLYIFHLRGNQRTAGELSRKEGGKVFGSGSRAPVAISLLVKNPATTMRGRILFRDIGDYLTRDEKLSTIAGFESVSGISRMQGWTVITPDAHGDWLKQRAGGFEKFVAMGDKGRGETSIFESYSNGVKTQREAWTYSPSRRAVGDQMRRMIDAYNIEAHRFDAAHAGLATSVRASRVDDFVDADPARISWSRALKGDLARGKRFAYEERRIVPSLYRPFTRTWLYFDRGLNELVFRIPKMFPGGDATNRVIGVPASESRSGFGVLMADAVPSLHAADMVGAQYFPLYLHDDASDQEQGTQGSLFGADKPAGRRDAITDGGLAHFTSAYPGQPVTKEDVFYYVYGVLHSPEYRERYADNLGKELPRIPRMKRYADFRAFSDAGRKLGDLHVGYEQVPEHPATIIATVKPLEPKHYRVEQMKFGKVKIDGKNEKDKTTVLYNPFITVKDIPLEAYEYVVNGKSAIEWVMERQGVDTDKASGIVKDANDYATETVGDPRYPLSLLLRVITVSLETTRIVKSLPTLDILDADPPSPPLTPPTDLYEPEPAIDGVLHLESGGGGRGGGKKGSGR